MSKRINRQFISISPPLFLEGNACERMVSEGFPCVHYNGRGKRERKVCPVCKGTGKLKAVITVEWKSFETED